VDLRWITKWGDIPDASESLASFSGEGRGSLVLPQVAGVSIVVAGSPHSATDTLTVDSQVA